ncbi:uncharacterized protein B0I36DRAFT_320024 [Microdochium trichocladiopsis]|uniref:Uncharacterized protein n=1 Tax=Microdochium trichocladiopsis TaxID=1682393 RepID=A0A9P8Y7U6_9PEZI|nr:uncharacterized protein B0I36DRAFT_320024 [Microdochium trichocladiopsis]KAH7032779.1 hypothetical protein B0I36DRAFT_320024 [Microdochium trichocladiopsis]
MAPWMTRDSRHPSDKPPFPLGPWPGTLPLHLHISALRWPTQLRDQQPPPPYLQKDTSSSSS